MGGAGADGTMDKVVIEVVENLVALFAAELPAGADVEASKTLMRPRLLQVALDMEAAGRRQHSISIGTGTTATVIAAGAGCVAGCGGDAAGAHAHYDYDYDYE